MIKSMTGFGRGEHTIENRKITVEIKSVNHRYCDVNVRMPRKLGFLENDIKNYIKKHLSRGKVDVYLSYEDNSDKQESIKFNEALASEYLGYFGKVSEMFGLDNDIKVSHMTRLPDVFTLEVQEDDEELLWSIMKGALDNALVKVVETRQVEGELLFRDIDEKLTAMSDALGKINIFTPMVVEEYRTKLEARLAELLDNANVDEGRLAQEVAIFADKSCIDEEIVRLGSHIEHMSKTLASTQPVGRKLDFLAQEMNREANTILSKANNLEIANEAIGLKTEIEKIREQIQNIE